jgi:hypothetical protein
MSEITAKEISRAQRRIDALSEAQTDLELQIEDLEEELAQAQAVYLDPRGMPAEVMDVLTRQLAGWPAKRWRELAALIEAHVRRSVDA